MDVPLMGGNVSILLFVDELLRFFFLEGKKSFLTTRVFLGHTEFEIMN